jgi:hypothetical protein
VTPRHRFRSGTEPGVGRCQRPGKRRTITRPILVLLASLLAFSFPAPLVSGGHAPVAPGAVGYPNPMHPSSTLGAAPTTRGPTGCGLSGPRETCRGGLATGSAGVAEWTNISSGLGIAPPPRRGAAMTFDAQDGYTLLFGGVDPSGHTLRDTWAYRATGWVSLTPALLNPRNSPPAVAFASMTFDASDGYVVLFGGWGTKGVNSESWSFVRGHWTAITLTSGTNPGGRANGSATYDAHDGYVVLFGGAAGGKSLRDTWAYHAGTWTDLTPNNLTASTSPTRRSAAAIAYDAAQSMVVLFGGSTSPAFTASAVNDTWEFSGGLWRNVTAGPTPSPRFAAGAAYDAAHAQILLVGGIVRNGAVINETWTFQNGVWTNRTVPGMAAPSARASSALSTVIGGSPSGDLVLMFGGGSGAGRALADTWVFGAGGLGITAPSLTPAATDANLTVSLAAAAYGGSGGYTYNWSGLPLGCTSANLSSFVCQPTTAGQYSIVAEVHDGAGGTSASAARLLLINPTLAIVGFTVSPFTVYVGVTNVSFAASVVGGTGHLGYNYSGLPPGCLPSNSSKIRCVPTTGGTFVITVRVVDGVNATAQASLSLLVRLSAPASVWTASRIAAVVGVAVVAVVIAAIVLRRHRRLRPPRPAAVDDRGREGLLDEVR